MRDETQQATANFLHRFLYALILLGLIILQPLLLFPNVPTRSLGVISLLISTSVIQLILIRRGKLRQISACVVYISWFFITAMILTDNGVNSPDVIGYVLVVLLAAFLLGECHGIAVAVLCIAALFGMVLAEHRGWLPIAPPEPNAGWSSFAVFSFFILLAGMLQITLTRILQHSYEVRQRMLETQVATEHLLRKTEERLRQSEKMEAVGRLAGGVAHDFSNLLQVIAGNVDIALMDLKPDSPTAGYLRAISHASDSAAVLIRQLLTYSRRHISELRVLDLNESVKNLQTMLVRLLGTNIQVIVRSEPELGCVRADPHQVEEMLVNLAVNARDAMPMGGQLFIETSNITLDADFCRQHDTDLAPGEYVSLTVSDSGIGIDEEVRANIFEPFFTTKPSGTGLGLAMVYGAMKQLHGAVEVHSEKGAGALFKLYFPRVYAAADTQPVTQTQAIIPESQGTVLFVEDSPDVLTLGNEILHRCGYQVLACANAEEALNVAETYSGPLRILVTDVMLPGLNGHALAEQLCRLRPGLPVLYTSGYDDNVIACHGVLEPDVAFLAKPYSPTALAQKICEVLEKSSSCSGTHTAPKS